ncbi:phage integrase family protein [Salsuginibacillus halophilus]|uniref:Phage integrase family protein n=1 Tax=Salsuginibacillus halophilus TaxID=517424 RepID=A0A2P8H4Z6_9BACI|nr:tyrosine-type recombinase/integrase [Salsuginibacillus halophilus]PSL41269.1 phage integrase family protein [Salsuginibacillus halophilus]
MVKKQHLINVQPLRSEDEIKEMVIAIRRGAKGTPKKRWLSERDVMLFLFGINTGLRVSDIVGIRVADVRDKSSFTIQEGKTAKKRTVTIESIRREIDNYIDGKPDHAYLFPSQKGSSHVSSTQVYRLLKSAGDWIGRQDIGTHTMRKTFGYHFYKQTKDVAMLQSIFNHSAPSITKRYIGITDEEIEESLKGFRLG